MFKSSYPTVGVACFGRAIRLSSLFFEYVCFRTVAHRKVSWAARTNVFEVMFLVRY